MNAPSLHNRPACGTARIIHATGLHARPSVMFTQLAKTFDAAVFISDHIHGPWIDAKSIVKVMGLKAPFDTMIYIRAEGIDAEMAVQKLSRLIEDDFEETHCSNGTANVQSA
jgi:phosphocarrier protein HPr